MGVCCGKSEVKNPEANGKYTGENKSSIINENFYASFVDILHKDGNVTNYMYNPEYCSSLSPNEIINITAQTIDNKKTTLQISASEKTGCLTSS